ncbi:MAG: formate dehydrogenase accessory sulfurtransferase FdhD [Promethearchaeota archaeon]
MSVNSETMGFLMRQYRSLPTIRVIGDVAESEDDLIAIESALELRLNNEFLAAFVCSPSLEKELSLGYLLSTGVIKSFNDIDELKYSGNRCYVRVRENKVQQIGFSRVQRFIGTECSAPDVLKQLRTASGLPSISKPVTVSLQKIRETAKIMRKSQTGRELTGALHGALVHSLTEDKYVVAEDLGRHNAADKAIGLAVLQDFHLSECLMMSSGRLTADIVSKCAWAGIPLLVSFAVTTVAGIKFAQKANLTLVGAFKGKKMRIYNQGACKMLHPS